MRAVRFCSRLLALTALVTGLTLLLGITTASAVVIRQQVESFGPDGTTASSFTGPSGGIRDLTFNQGTRGLYAVVGGGPGIYGFDVSALPTHQPLAGFSPLVTAATGGDPGIAVDNTALPSAGNVYFVSESTGLIYGFDKTGAPLGGNFPIDPAVTPGSGDPKNPLKVDICGAGADSAGNLWVPNFATQSILEYSSTGVYKSTLSVAAQGNFRPCSVGFDSNDDLYATEGNGPSGPTYRYSAASGYTSATLITSESGRGVAVDRSTHHVFTINNGNAAGEYDTAGNLISTTAGKDSTGDVITPTPAGLAGANIRGIAVDSANNHLYLADEGSGTIRVFGDPQTFPDVSLDPAPSGITNTTATVEGTISAQGVALSDCHFEYVNATEAPNFDDLSSGGSVPCSPGSIPTDSATHSITATLSGLSPSTPYRFRLVGANANGAIASAKTGSFETPGPAIVETTGSPIRTTTSALLSGRVSPQGTAATYHFEYGDQGPCDSNPCVSTEPRSVGRIDEVQSLTVEAIAGQFRLTFGPDTTIDLPYNASAAEVSSALQALPSIGAGNVSVSGGPGSETGSRPYEVRFTGSLSGVDVPQLSVSNGGVPLSGKSSVTATTATQGGPGVKEVQSLTVEAIAGQFRLTFGPDTTIDLPYNASAAEVSSALQALPSIGAGNVSVGGGPGSETGSRPYEISFEGALENENVALLDVSNGTEPLAGRESAETATTTPGGFADEFEFVAQRIEGLEPNTTYHYRVIADNGNSAGATSGGDMTVTTRAGEAEALSHGPFPGPPGSDRAWELASAPDTGGNPVGPIQLTPGLEALSAAGDRVVYGVAGGTPQSEVGTLATRLFAERTPSGWQTKSIYPRREDATGSVWLRPSGPDDLSQMVAENFPGGTEGEFSIWRMFPDGSPERLFSSPNLAVRGRFLAASEEGSRVLTDLIGPMDPAHPVPPETYNLYDISSGGTPQLVDLLPDGTVPGCGVGPGAYPEETDSSHWLSADGSFAFFPALESCTGTERLYMRNLVAETTKLISGPPVSGPECDTTFIKSIPGFAFIYTASRLTSDDVAPSSCSQGSPDADVYRYDIASGALDCVTCVLPGIPADVSIANGIGVSEDGSRVYFTSGHRLLAGAPAGEGMYRVDVESGDLAYVGPFRFDAGLGNKIQMSNDGAVLAFGSEAPGLNAVGGQQNGGFRQTYLYDDRDRSLVCVSCPEDGSLPPSASAVKIALDADGGDLAFATTLPLSPADQNTARPGQPLASGTDVYEWREGRLLLASDGLTNWPPGEVPQVGGITPSGRDLFFTEAAQLTPDALDGYNRLYDARIGGGFEFPAPPKPCPLEVCQGTPKGAPEEAAPGTASFAGAGNATTAHRAKKKHKKKSHKRHAKKTHKAKHNRRTAR